MKRIATLALIGCAASSPPLAPPAPAPALHLEPYRFTARDGTIVDAELGSFEVPERRADPASRRITLSFVRFRATAATAGPPIVYLSGGPGRSGIETATGPRFPIFMALRAQGDVIALDQRGTGRSNHIPPCAGDVQQLLGKPLTRDHIVEQTRRDLTACFAEWSAKGVDIDGYTTRESADDLEDLRRALGARTVNLWGISYGSHLGLAMLKYHERSVSRAVLGAIEGLDQTVKRPALSDEMLGRAAPELVATMRRVHAKLEANPVEVPLALPGAPSDAPPLRVRLGGFPIQLLAAGLIADPSGLPSLARLYLALDHGAYDAVVKLIVPALVQPYTGMPEAMDIASGITAQRLAQITREARTSVLGDALNFPMPHALGIRPSLDLGDAFRAPFSAATPVLFISGTLDGRTYVAEAAAELRGLRNGRHLIVDNGGHNIFEADPRIGQAIASFFAGAEVPERIALPPPQ